VFFLRADKSDYVVCNPYLASAQRLHPNVYDRQCSSNYSTSLEALQHYDERLLMICMVVTSVATADIRLPSFRSSIYDVVNSLESERRSG
jgi:hypothetical protein